MTIALLRLLVAFYLEYFSPFLLVDVPAFAWWLWRTIPDYLPFYILATIVLYAAIRGRAHATVISPFHLPPEKTLPFSAATVANSLEDAFGMIRNEAEAGLRQLSGKVVGTVRSELAGLKLPEFTQFEIPTRFGVEVKGLSHEALVSVARKVWKRERVISGDVVVLGGKFRLLARSNDAGPWMSAPRVPTLESPGPACRELALEMLADFDPALLAAYKLAQKQPEAAHGRLLAVVSKPNASRTAQLVFELAAVLAAIKLDNQGKRTDSMNLLEKANRLLPKSALLAFNLGHTWQESNEPDAFANTLASYERALRLRPNFPEALNNLAVALDKKDDYDGALAAVEKALKLKPDHPVILETLGDVLRHRRQFEDAIDVYQKAVKLKPDHAKHRYNLGLTLREAEREEEAQREFAEAQRLDPRFKPPPGRQAQGERR